MPTFRVNQKYNRVQEFLITDFTHQITLDLRFIAQFMNEIDVFKTFPVETKVTSNSITSNSLKKANF